MKTLSFIAMNFSLAAAMIAYANNSPMFGTFNLVCAAYNYYNFARLPV